MLWHVSQLRACSAAATVNVFFASVVCPEEISPISPLGDSPWQHAQYLLLSLMHTLNYRHHIFQTLTVEFSKNQIGCLKCRMCIRLHRVLGCIPGYNALLHHPMPRLIDNVNKHFF